MLSKVRDAVTRYITKVAIREIRIPISPLIFKGFY
jgi:hypothetical protein